MSVLLFMESIMPSSSRLLRWPSLGILWALRRIAWRVARSYGYATSSCLADAWWQHWRRGGDRTVFVYHATTATNQQCEIRGAKHCIATRDDEGSMRCFLGHYVMMKLYVYLYPFKLLLTYANISYLMKLKNSITKNSHYTTRRK